MRLLADENVPLKTVTALRRLGEDVLAVAESSPGAADEHVLQLARAQSRVIVTFGRDYGYLLFGRGLAPPTGILYLRLLPESAEALAAQVVGLTTSGVQLEGWFTTMSESGIRQRPIHRVGGSPTEFEQ